MNEEMDEYTSVGKYANSSNVDLFVSLYVLNLKAEPSKNQRGITNKYSNVYIKLNLISKHTTPAATLIVEEFSIQTNKAICIDTPVRCEIQFEPSLSHLVDMQV